MRHPSQSAPLQSAPFQSAPSLLTPGLLTPGLLAPGLLALGLLVGCATAPLPAPPAAPPPPPGMEQLLGQAPEVALALLGQPRLDKREGQARQLQFASGCVLDVWYYPEGGHLRATHADARLADGRDFAAGDCLQLLLRARAPPAVAPAPATSAPQAPTKTQPRKAPPGKAPPGKAPPGKA